MSLMMVNSSMSARDQHTDQAKGVMIPLTLSKLCDGTLDVEAVLFVAMCEHVRDAAPLLVTEQAFECSGIGFANVLEDLAYRACGV